MRGRESQVCQFYSEGQSRITRVVRQSGLKSFRGFWVGGAKVALTGPFTYLSEPLSPRTCFYNLVNSPISRGASRTFKKPRKVPT